MYLIGVFGEIVIWYGTLGTQDGASGADTDGHVAAIPDRAPVVASPPGERTSALAERTGNWWQEETEQYRTFGPTSARDVPKSLGLSSLLKTTNAGTFGRFASLPRRLHSGPDFGVLVGPGH